MDYSWETRLLISSIRHAVIAGEPLRFNQVIERTVAPTGMKGWLTQMYADLHTFTHVHLLRAATEQRRTIPTVHFQPYFSGKRADAHLERLKPEKPACEASSMSGLTILSIMSVNTVKVGTTMKSMKPSDRKKEPRTIVRTLQFGMYFMSS